MKQVRMAMSFSDVEGHSELLGEFSDDDLLRLVNFREHVSELRNTKVIKEGYPSKFDIVWKSETGIDIITPEFNNELVSSFLHKLRPLILSDEPASYEKTSALIGQRFSHKAMKRHLKGIRSFFETSEFSKYGQITIADIPIFDQKTLKKWLNAYEYHQDSHKRDELKYIESEFKKEGVRKLFVLQLIERCRAVFLLDDLCEFIINF